MEVSITRVTVGAFCPDFRDHEMNISMDGGSVFLRVNTENGRQSVFDIVSKIETDLLSGFVDVNSISEMNAAVDHIAVQRSMAGPDQEG